MMRRQSRRRSPICHQQRNGVESVWFSTVRRKREGEREERKKNGWGTDRPLLVASDHRDEDYVLVPPLTLVSRQDLDLREVGLVGLRPFFHLFLRPVGRRRGRRRRRVEYRLEQLDLLPVEGDDSNLAGVDARRDEGGGDLSEADERAGQGREEGRWKEKK